MALASEIDRIAATTVFNGIRPLIRGALVALQVGFDGRSTSQISFLTSISGGTTEDLWLSDATHILYSLNADTEANSIRCSQTTLEAVKRAIENIGQRRGELGAINNRLEVAVRNTASTREVLSGAAAAINDLDVARATANLARLMILQQAGAAILAQANIAPKLALELLA
jgi:flagellin